MSEESFQGKKVLVTGGGGYFGHKLGNALKKKGAEVLAFDISWPLDRTAYKQLECVQVRYERSLFLFWGRKKILIYINSNKFKLSFRIV